MAAKKKPAAKTPPRATAPKVFDVAKPGRTAASSTSKPVIITNRPVMQDPMVTAPKPDEPTGAPPLKTAGKLVIKPLHDDLAVDKPEPAKANESTDTPISIKVDLQAEPEADTPEETPDDSAVSPSQEAEATDSKEPETIAFSKTTTGTPTKNPEVADNQLKPAKAPVSDVSSPAAVPAVDRTDKQLTPEQSEAALKAARERATELQEIIDKQEYFLPIKTVEQRRSRRFAILGLLLIILLGLAWYDVALDAGLLTNTYNLPHSHLFTVK